MLKLKTNKTLKCVLKYCKANSTIYKHFFVGTTNISNETVKGSRDDFELAKVKMLKNGIDILSDFTWFMKVRGAK